MAFAATPACDVDEDCGDHEFCSDAGKCVEAAEPLPVLFGDKRGGRVTGERARRGRDQVTFFGIDYSLARFIGNDDFRDVEQVTDYYPGVWNRLWAKEMMEDMEKAIGPVTQEIEVVDANNAKVTSKQIIRKDGGDSNVTTSLITSAKLASLVKGYSWPDTLGYGLVLVVDRYVKLQHTGCTWIVYFDLRTRAIESANRECVEAGGFGFRNYWFRTAKGLMPAIEGQRP